MTWTNQDMQMLLVGDVPGVRGSTLLSPGLKRALIMSPFLGLPFDPIVAHPSGVVPYKSCYGVVIHSLYNMQHYHGVHNQGTVRYASWGCKNSWYNPCSIATACTSSEVVPYASRIVKHSSHNLRRNTEKNTYRQVCGRVLPDRISLPLRRHRFPQVGAGLLLPLLRRDVQRGAALQIAHPQ
jgi:hypothetical protein